MKIKCDLFYVRNFISLIHCACISKQMHNKNYKILYLNYTWINKEIFFYFKNFFYFYFDEINTFSFKSFDYLNSISLKEKNNSFIKRIILRSKNLNNFKNKLKFKKDRYIVENIFSGGDDFHLLFKNHKKIYYVEHGIGNYRDGLIFKRKKLLSFINYFLKFFNLLGFKIFYLKKFDFYISILSNKINLNLNLNNYEVKYLSTKKEFFLSVLKKISKYLKKNIKDFPYKNKKKIFLNITDFKHISNNETLNLIKTVIKQINKNEIIIFKDHPRVQPKKNKLKKIFKKELKKNKIKYYEINNYLLKKLPMELLIYLLNSKKLISSWSSTPLFCSILFGVQFKTILLLEYSLKFPINFESKRNEFFFKTVKSKFKNIIYL
jgi:hypothetical protein